MPAQQSGLGFPAQLRSRCLRLTQLAVAPQWVAFANGNIGHLYRTGGEDNAAGLRRTLEETGFFERVSLRTPESHPNNGDIVLLAGKGHERAIIGPDGPQPWDERAEAEEALRRAGYR